MNVRSQNTQSQWTPEKVEATRNEVLRRAAQDPVFRRLCLQNAAAAVVEVSGLDLPEGIPRIRFVERLEEIVIALPPSRVHRAEISDEDLTLVAGGAGRLQEEAKQLQAEAQQAANDASFIGKIAR